MNALRHAVAMAAAVAVLAGAGCAASGGGETSGGGAPTTAPPGPHLTPTCPRQSPSARPPAVTVAQLNRIVAGLNLPLWQAGDIGASARLPDHRMVWVFGDTVRGAGISPRVVANSMLVTSGLCTSVVETTAHGPVIPDRPDGVVHWPMSVALLSRTDGDSLVVVTARIRRGSRGAMDFTYLGSSASVFRVAPDGVPTLDHQLDITPDNPDPGQVNWGSAMVVSGGWLYVYGTQLPSRRSFGRALYAARAPSGDAAARPRWQFWNGSEWVSDPGQARAVLPAQGGVSQTMSVSVVDGRYVIVSKRDGDLGDAVFAWTSDQATGPWVARRGLRADFTNPQGVLQYAPLAHPGITLSDGRLLISISRNTTDFARLLRDPRLGRPVFAEIDRP